MTIKIDKSLCISCGACASLWPDVFELGEDGKAQVVKGAAEEKIKECIKEAIESCPVSAIS